MIQLWYRPKWQETHGIIRYSELIEQKETNIIDLCLLYREVQLYNSSVLWSKEAQPKEKKIYLKRENLVIIFLFFFLFVPPVVSVHTLFVRYKYGIV